MFAAARVIAVGEACHQIAHVALPDRLTTPRAGSVRAGCPAIHHDENHPRPATGLARKDAARILDVALSTTAVRKAGTLIAAANPNIASANSSMMNLLGCRRSEAVWTSSYRSA